MAINLLPTSIRLSKEDLALKQKLKSGSIFVLTVYLIVIVSLAGYWFYWNRKNQGLTTQVEQAETKLNNLKVVEGTLSLIKSKLGVIISVTNNNPTVLATWKQLDQLTGESILLDSLNISNDSIQLNGQAPDLKMIEEFENRILANEDFMDASWQSYVRTPTGLKFNMVLKRREKK